MTKPPTCTYDAERGWCLPEHVAACASADCRGCRPCGADHCELNGRCGEHVEHDAGIFTCPRCIGRVKREVRAIVDCYALVDLDVELRGYDLAPLLDQAGESGIDSEAFNLIGPAADPGQWAERRRRIHASYDARGWCDWPRHEGIADNDPHHPYAVLGGWDMAMRESYGPQTDLFITVTSAADYLTGPLLEKFAHTREFEEFAREVGQCLRHLEAVLHDSRGPEKGAPCPACKAAGHKAEQLVKHYAKHAKLSPGEVCSRVTCHCDNDRAGHCRICAGHDDTWHCGANAEHWWSDVDYRIRVDGDYVQHATHLPAPELAERLGITVSTVRRWAGRTLLEIDDDGEAVYGDPKLKARGRGKDGRKVYLVTDAEALAMAAGEARRRTMFGAPLDAGPLGVSKSG